MLLGLLTAFAQAPPDPKPFDLGFPISTPAPEPVVPVPLAPVERRSEDPVFVAPLQPTDPSLAPDAIRLSQVLRDYLGARYRVRGIETVPPWPDYDANIYMMVCPAGHYSGCALVCGDRIKSTWTVGGTVSRTGTGVNVDLVFIGNESSRELIQFGVGLTSDDQVLGSSADTILKKIVEGAFDAVDLRILDGDPREQEKLQRAQNQVLAASLAELESSQGEVERITTEVNRRKLTKTELDAMRANEQVKPWESLGMSQSEYRRYRNSGKPVDAWRSLRRGRLGQIIVRVGLGGGLGPYNQQFDGRFAVDGPTLLHLEQYQFVSQGPNFGGDFELGFGVLPFLDITAHYASRRGQFNYQINQEQVGNPIFLDPEVRGGIGSWSVGGRVAFVPLQVSPIRPSIHAGILYWQGSSWQSIFGGLNALQEMRNLSLIAAQLGPGVELSAGKRINVFGRGLLDIPLAGNRSEQIQTGGNTLQMPADPASFKISNIGFTLQVGLVGRLSLFKAKAHKRGSTMRFEEEEQDL